MEGLFGNEETAASMKSREGWMLMMPELEGGLSESAEMLKWIVGGSEAVREFVLF
jgi:CCR4-NOT transcriptional complex subunit CAF120